MTIAQRFYSQGGQLFADRRPVSLEWAQRQILSWWTEAEGCTRQGNDRLAAEYHRQADALECAMIDARRWQRASGPNAAEAYSNKVREMLSASLRQDGAA